MLEYKPCSGQEYEIIIKKKRNTVLEIIGEPIILGYNWWINLPKYVAYWPRPSC